MQEKAERLIQLEKINEKKRDNILKKIKNMNIRKEIFDRTKYEKILESKKLRQKRFSSCLRNRKNMDIEESERRKDILFYQSVMLGRSQSRDNIFNMKKRIANEKALNEQMTLEKNLTLFNKKMNILKSQSIFKKTPQERLQIFKDLKKKETEKRKKELEEKLNKIN